MESSALYNPKLVFEGTGLSSTEWSLAKQKTVAYNMLLLQDKRFRGPFYHELHTNTIQVNDSYQLPRSHFHVPSAVEQQGEKEDFLLFSQRRQNTPSISIFYPQEASVAASHLSMQPNYKASPSMSLFVPDTKTVNPAATPISPQNIGSHSVLFHQKIQTGSKTGISCSTCKKTIASSGNDVESILLACMACNRTFHPRSCLSLSNKILGRIKQLTPVEKQTPQVKEGNDACILYYSWECSDCKKCHRCKSIAIGPNAMTCEFCDQATHKLCTTESLIGEYACKDCKIFFDKYPKPPQKILAKPPLVPIIPFTSLTGKRSSLPPADAPPPKKPKTE